MPEERVRRLFQLAHGAAGRNSRFLIGRGRQDEVQEGGHVGEADESIQLGGRVVHFLREDLREAFCLEESGV